MQRRHVLSVATAVVPALAGCIGSFTSDGTLREVKVELYNTDTRARTFHLALESEAGVLDWESHTIDAGVDERVTITPDDDVSPVALHGVVHDFAGSVDILGVGNLDEDYCLWFDFRYPTDERPKIAQVADIEC
jgi:hypothetical protein